MRANYPEMIHSDMKLKAMTGQQWIYKKISNSKRDRLGGRRVVLTETFLWNVGTLKRQAPFQFWFEVPIQTQIDNEDHFLGLLDGIWLLGFADSMKLSWND